MTPDQLFEQLSSQTSLEGRQQLVEKGLNSGISLIEITEMLDYIELCASQKQQTPQIKNQPTASRIGPKLRSIWQSLVWSFRLR